MRVQIDRFEDNDRAVLFLYPSGKSGFDAPCAALPEGASPGDVFDVRFERNEKETNKAASENRRLMDELLGREEG